ncbi:fibronectin type III domain-containing protein [uncultured Lacinutrix sp.]|uniref:fibronectin type III domain-containing protein n=1 Tax=uncultured Lacinutrix sp. TaxID=574032 RepID=UPI00261C2612|nr:fibronectin type III domain-containing protein [uncultured Lacinutrix sp.]
MKKITLSLFMMLFVLLGFSQIQVGEGTNQSQAMPFDPFYGYSYSQTIYTAADINTSGTITGLQYYFSGTTSLDDSQDLTIYIGHTTKTAFASNTDWEPVSGLTASYTGGIDVSAGVGWVTLTLDTPFAYNGTDNLVIAFDENMASYDSSGDDFWNTSTPEFRSIYYLNDTTNSDPADPEDATGTVPYAPSIIFNGLVSTSPPNCDAALSSPVDGSVNASVSGDLSWSAATGQLTGYNVTVGTSTGTSDVYNVALGNVTTTNVGGLMPNTQYFVNIVPVNGVGPATGCTEYSFTTIDSPGCPVVTATPDVACGNYESSLSWDAIDIASSYTVKIGTTSGGTDIADNVNNFSNNAYTFEGAPNTTYYYTISASNEAGTSIDCSEGSFTTAVDLCYCDPSSTNANTTTLIDNVSTTGANVNLSNLESGLSSNHYANNYDTMGVTSFATGTFDFTIEVEGGTLGLGIWVDWNGDKVHDVSENVFTTTSYSNGPFSGTITVPGGTTNGEYHMRIIADFNDLNPGDGDACSLSSGRGETEDYKLTVVDPPVCGAPTALTATNIMFNAADLGWTDAGIATLYNVEIVDVTAGDVVSGSADYSGVSNPYTVINLVEDNDYEFYVQGDCTADGTSLWVGPFAFTTPLACPAPTSLDADNITAVSADLSWTAGDSESLWNIELVDLTAGETVSGTASFTGVTNPYTLTNLSSVNDYAYYVQGDCSPNGDSTWVGPYYFTTACSFETPNYLEDFTSFLNTCWSEATGPITGPTSFGSSIWAADGFANDGTQGSARVNIYTTGNDEWLLTPIFDLTGGGFEINLDVALTAYTGTAAQTLNSDDAVYVMQSIDGGATWTTIYTWDAANSPSNTGNNVTIDVSGVTSATAQFAIFSLEGSTSGGDMNFYVDNFQVRTPPPANDECVGAIMLTLGAEVAFDNTGATDSAAETCYSGTVSDIWYSFVAPVSGGVTITAGGSTQYTLYSGVDCDNLIQIGTCSQSVHAGLAAGTYFVSVTDDGTAKVPGASTIKVDDTATLSNIEFESSSIFSYYPNPVKNTLTLNAQQAITNVSVFNMLGQQVIRTAPNAVSNIVDMSNLQSGAYFVQVTVGTSVETVRIIKN